MLQNNITQGVNLQLLLSLSSEDDDVSEPFLSEPLEPESSKLSELSELLD